jgi:hypothetical protein
MPPSSIDISWLDWAYKSSTCDVCIVDSAAIYIMLVKFRNTFGPLHRSSPFIGERLCQAIQMEHGLICIAERTQNAVYIVRYLYLLTLFLSDDPRYSLGRVAESDFNAGKTSRTGLHSFLLLLLIIVSPLVFPRNLCFNSSFVFFFCRSRDFWIISPI